MSRKRYKVPAHQKPALPARAVPETKVNPSYATLVSFSNLPQPVAMPKNYSAFAKEGYGSDQTVFKCINYIITNGSAIPPKLYTDASMDTEIPKHPLLDLLARPNPEQTGVDLREAFLGYFLIAGNSYLYAIRKGTTGPPAELWTLEPDKVKVIPDQQRGIVGYEVAGFDAMILPANIGRMKSWNPNNPIYGMSPIEVLSILIDQQAAANKWNLALLQNFARPPGAWVAPASMGKNERDQLEAKLAAKMNGAANAGRAPVLDAGLDWKPTAIPPADMDWQAGRVYNAGAIANGYNISPQLIGDTSATTYDNMDQAKAASYTEEIFPTLDKFYAMLTLWLVPMYPDLPQTAYLYYDKTTVEVVQSLIQTQKSAEATRAITAYMQGACTLNQSLVMQGLPELGPEGEVFRLGQVLVPRDQLLKYAEQSMTTPALAPKGTPEPLVALPAPGDPLLPPSAGHQPPKAPAPEDVPAPPPKAPGKPQKALQRKARDEVTHLLWECDGAPCDFCLENDGEVVADGEAFTNGCTGPDDSHRFCECTVTELSVADDVALPSGRRDGGDDWQTFLAATAVGVLASRHARDVAARDQAQAAAQADDAGDDPDELDYAKGAAPRQRKAQRDAYRAYVAEALE